MNIQLSENDERAVDELVDYVDPVLDRMGRGAAAEVVARLLAGVVASRCLDGEHHGEVLKEIMSRLDAFALAMGATAVAAAGGEAAAARMVAEYRAQHKLRTR